MINKNFFIGIDSGGTKSEILITDEFNTVLYKKNIKAFHYSIHGFDKTVNHIINILATSLKENKLDIKNCKGICIGLSGVRDIKVKSQIQKQIIKSLGCKNILIESDSTIALYGAFEGKDGLILICGTGSILFGILNGEFIRIGGWGRIIGDYGSGYEIGKNAIKHLTTGYDGGKKISNLSSAIEKEFSINKANLLHLIYQNNFNLQNLVPIVLERADKKDKNALKIIDNAVNDLLQHFKIFFKTSGLRKKIGLAFSGSIIENENVLTLKLKKKIKRNFKLINIIDKLHSPAEGAILLAKNKFYKN
jgi:N-acetylglucosamine kinase-like BadF-type ATPase